MKRRGSGTILTLSATLSGGTFEYMARVSVACGAIEVMTQALAAEFGPSGIRANCVRGSAIPETRTIQETGAGVAAVSDRTPQMGVPPLGRPITVEETVKAVVFLASDLASGMTAQITPDTFGLAASPRRPPTTAVPSDNRTRRAWRPR